MWSQLTIGLAVAFVSTPASAQVQPVTAQPATAQPATAQPTTAQPAPPPAAQPPAYPATEPPHPGDPALIPYVPKPPHESYVFLQAGLALFVPIGDFENVAGPSGGLSIAAGYQLLEALSLVVNFDHTLIYKNETVPSSTDVSTTLIGGGVRLSQPGERKLRAYAQGVAGFYTLRASANNVVYSDTDLVAKAGIGATYQLRPFISIGGQGSYLYSKFSGDVGTGSYFDSIQGLILEANASVKF